MLGVQEALTEKKTRREKRRVLPLVAHNLEWHGGAKWWSPSSKKEADARLDAQQRHEEELESANTTKHELQHTQKLLNEKEKEDNRKRRVREKEERDRLRAEKAREVAECKTQKERDKKACDAEETVEASPRGKRKASKSPSRPTKKRRGGAAACSGACSVTPPQEAKLLLKPLVTAAPPDF